jgi:glutathione S-transferase
MAPVILYFLQASRSIRIAWLLEELELPYSIEFWDRVNNQAPQAFREACGNPLGKSPTIKDGDLTIYESGAIAEYLCETYDKEGRMLPRTQPLRSRVLQWVHAAEGIFLMHAIPVTYLRWFSPPDADLETTEKGMGINVLKDLDWLDTELSKNHAGFLVGDTLTVADIMVHFSVQFIFARQLGTKGVDTTKWKHVNEWLTRCENTVSYMNAVDKSDYTLSPKAM